MKSEKGFATLLFLSLIPLLMAGGLAAFFAFAFMKADVATLNVCRAGQLVTQDKVGRDLERLMKMNPKALKLRADQRIAEIKLKLAVAGANPYAIAAAEARLLYVQSQRQALAIRQRLIIQSANAKFIRATPQITDSILAEWRHHMLPMRSWISANIVLTSLKVPTLSVRPDFPDEAPAYERLPHFEEVQSWAHNWQLQAEGSNWTRNFLKFRGRFQRSCGTSLYADGNSWIGKLKKVKFLLKPASYSSF